MSSLDIITKRLADEQDKILANQRFIEETRAALRFDPTAYSRKRSRGPVFAGVAVALAAAAAVVVMMMPSSVTVVSDGVDVGVGAWIASTPEHAKRLDFSDGSTIRLTATSGLRIHDLQTNGAHLLLERGRLDAHVAHRADTHWKLDVGPYLITVTGTRFNVSWSPMAREFRLAMTEGSVRVEGPMIATGTTLSAGEQLHASLSSKRLEIKGERDPGTTAVAEAPLDDNRPEHDGVTEGAAPSTESASPLNESRKRSADGRHHSLKDWKSAAKQGRYADAVALAEKAGINRISASASALELMTLGDAARHVGKRRLAEDLYKQVRRRFPQTAHASSAAFALGKVAFDQKRSYREAATWFEACLNDAQTGVLEREASGRLIESLKRSGNAAGAKAAAERYLARFPNGPHAPLARKLAR